MNRNLLLVVCVGGALLLPSMAGARGHVPTLKGPTVQNRAGGNRYVVDLKTRSSRKQKWSARFARFRGAVRSAPRKLVKRIRGFRRARQVKRNTPCSGGTCRPMTASVRTASGVRLVARVRPLSRGVYIKRSRSVLKNLRGRDKMAAVRMLASRRVRRSPAAQHAVLSYLGLRGMKGGRALPMSMKDFGSVVGSKGWSSRRMANFALVLQQASSIARREHISARQAFDKALKINGIYNRYYRSRCGA